MQTPIWSVYTAMKNAISRHKLFAELFIALQIVIEHQHFIRCDTIDGFHIVGSLPCQILVKEDEILTFGPDISALPPSAPFARISLLRVGDIESDEDDTEQAFRAIQNMDFVKYRIFPKGYMIRTSSENHREQVRISREAVKNGISFERIGNSFLNKYKEDDNILAAKVLFITEPNADYAELLKCARQVSKITLGLTKILEGMSTDCTTCQLKPICDEVEGMKELHFGKQKHTTE